jgi:hypothetical protein
MKVLTLTQPWATLVALGVKQVETRSWFRDFEGRLAIHAAKGFPEDARMACVGGPIQRALDAGGFLEEDTLPRGAIVAVCNVSRILRITSFATIKIQAREYCGVSLTDEEEAFGDYSRGRFAWVLRDIRELEHPIEARGALGLWDYEGPLI